MSDPVSLSDKLVKPTRSAKRMVILWRPLATLVAPGCESTRSRIRGSMYLPNVCLICSLARSSWTKKLKESVSAPTSSADRTGSWTLRLPFCTSRMAEASERTGWVRRSVMRAATTKPRRTVEIVAAMVNQST